VAHTTEESSLFDSVDYCLFMYISWGKFGVVVEYRGECPAVLPSQDSRCKWWHSLLHQTRQRTLDLPRSRGLR